MPKVAVSTSGDGVGDRGDGGGRALRHLQAQDRGRSATYAKRGAGREVVDAGRRRVP
jgi:hypothetical protein